jgi:hypothetical protein
VTVTAVAQPPPYSHGSFLFRPPATRWGRTQPPREMGVRMGCQGWTADRTERSPRIVGIPRSAAGTGNADGQLALRRFEQAHNGRGARLRTVHDSIVWHGSSHAGRSRVGNWSAQPSSVSSAVPWCPGCPGVPPLAAGAATASTATTGRRSTPKPPTASTWVSSGSSSLPTRSGTSGTCTMPTSTSPPSSSASLEEPEEDGMASAVPATCQGWGSAEEPSHPAIVGTKSVLQNPVPGPVRGTGAPQTYCGDTGGRGKRHPVLQVGAAARRG